VVSALRLGVIGTVCARLWRVGDTLVVIVLVIAAVILFARGTSVFISLDKQKLEVLRRFNGQTVTLGIGVRGIIEQTGTLVIGEDRLRVTLLNGTPRAVPVADIRWITDPISGTRSLARGDGSILPALAGDQRRPQACCRERPASHDEAKPAWSRLSGDRHPGGAHLSRGRAGSVLNLFLDAFTF
jgi:hypothetical protein